MFGYDFDNGKFLSKSSAMFWDFSILDGSVQPRLLMLSIDTQKKFKSRKKFRPESTKCNQPDSKYCLCRTLWCGRLHISFKATGKILVYESSD